MSIHVCKCEHNGKEEFHLRYPGLPEENAQNIADKINGGALEAYDFLKKIAESPWGINSQLYLILKLINNPSKTVAFPADRQQAEDILRLANNIGVHCLYYRDNFLRRSST